jgi:hypothetical protein
MHIIDVAISVIIFLVLVNLRSGCPVIVANYLRYTYAECQWPVVGDPFTFKPGKLPSYTGYTELTVRGSQQLSREDYIKGYTYMGHRSFSL